MMIDVKHSMKDHGLIPSTTIESGLELLNVRTVIRTRLDDPNIGGEKKSIFF
jgi:hypothetical protein